MESTYKPETPSYDDAYQARLALAEMLGWEAERVARINIEPGRTYVTDVIGDLWVMKTVNLQTTEWKKL